MARKTGKPNPNPTPDTGVQEEGNSQEVTQEKKKSTYNPETAKRYRQRLMAFAKAGGYEPKERVPGSGNTEKRQSSKGTTYYYTPWSKLTDEQKRARFDQARDRSRKEREYARKYKEEHGLTKKDD